MENIKGKIRDNVLPLWRTVEKRVWGIGWYMFVEIYNDKRMSKVGRQTIELYDKIRQQVKKEYDKLHTNENGKINPEG